MIHRKQLNKFIPKQVFVVREANLTEQGNREKTELFDKRS
jgi:hypothetical protein